MKRSWILAALLSGCSNVQQFSGTFDTPGAIAVLDPAVGGPFDQPVGYAADQHGGRIRVLALARGGNYLESSPWASFFRGRAIATGRARLLDQLAAWAPDTEQASVIATDTRHNAVIRVPHIDGRGDGFPAPVKPVVASITFDDVDASGDSANLTWIDAEAGRSATETWTIVYTSGGYWTVEGSRSGRQNPAYTGAPYTADENAIAFQIDGAATPGDRLVLEVDSGIVETVLEGPPTGLSIAPDQSGLLVSSRLSNGEYALGWYDPATLTETAGVTLPAGARPGRAGWSESGDRVFIADLGRPVVYELAGVGSTTPIEHAMPWPVTDVAMLSGESGNWLYVAPLGLQSVWLYDLDLATLIDINRATPGLDGMDMRSPVQGLTAIHEPYTFPFVDGNGDQETGRSVAVSLYSGKVVWMEEATGCLVSDRLGPRTELLSVNNDYDASFDLSSFLTAWLENAEASNRHVHVNRCAGIAPLENWEMRYDRIRQGWVAEGSISGEQASVAVEDQRWVSDNGAIHLLIRAGRIASEDGWELGFRVLDGVLAADGDNDDNDRRDVTNFDFPAEPAVFYDTAVDGTRKPWVVVSASAGDIITRIDATTGRMDSIWD